ncbi:uncharacterized protein LOC114313764 [Camellia sinensis]|uniref:uncharacterized protein LOC114313764 n=1 Tax=Camellia sinensis TaxID=4442 RepID=UPI00103581CD|nr:uncharacterized protein LOC114313764 [Camellia sinensis]
MAKATNRCPGSGGLREGAGQVDKKNVSRHGGFETPNLGLTWFERLPEGCIAFWTQLVEAFVNKFKANTKMPLEVNQLLAIDIGEKETLKSYNNRYGETFNQFGECPTNLAIAQYKRGLPVGHRDKIGWKHIRVEEDVFYAKARSNTTMMLEKKATTKVNMVSKKGKLSYHTYNDPPQNNEETKARKLKVRTAITTIFKKPIYQILNEIRNEPFIQRLTKLGKV